LSDTETLSPKTPMAKRPGGGRHFVPPYGDPAHQLSSLRAYSPEGYEKSHTKDNSKKTRNNTQGLTLALRVVIGGSDK
jgi:hypothetical protein